jgi:TPR repeat protein
MNSLEYEAESKIYHASEKLQKQGYNLCVKHAHNDAMLCFLKAVCEYKGYGTKKNYKKCIKTLIIAMERGSVFAPGLLAYMYDEGIGVEKNAAIAYDLYVKGAKLGDFDAMYNLAEVYSKGDLVACNIRKSNYWQKKANKVVSILHSRIAHRMS